MNLLRKAWRKGGRLAVCLLLLFWICHSIFSNEAQSACEARGADWDTLSRGDRWHQAWTVGPRELWRTVALLPVSSLVVSLGFMGATLFLGVWRWRMVLRVHGLGLPVRRALTISMVAQFFNAFLLGSTGGDLMKAYYAARETHHKKTEAVVTVLADRLIGLFSMLLFAGLMMLLNLRFMLSHRELGAVIWVLACMLAGCGLVVGLAFWGGVSRAWPGARHWLRRLPKGDLLEQAINAFRHFGRERGFLWRALGVSALLNTACVLQVMTIASGLGLQVPWLLWFVIVPVIICISALPITPSGLGIRENLYVLTLAGPGLQVPATTALAVSLLAYFGFLAWSLAGGVVYLLVREREHLAEMASEPPAA